MRVIAIGATGFIGRDVVAKLAEAGHEVTVLHRGKTPLPARRGVTEIHGERSTIREMRSEFRAWSPEVVVDMILSSAAQARATLEAFRGIARRVVAISSGDVYRAMAVVHRLDSGPAGAGFIDREFAITNADAGIFAGSPRRGACCFSVDR